MSKTILATITLSYTCTEDEMMATLRAYYDEETVAKFSTSQDKLDALKDLIEDEPESYFDFADGGGLYVDFDPPLKE